MITLTLYSLVPTWNVILTWFLVGACRVVVVVFKGWKWYVKRDKMMAQDQPELDIPQFRIFFHPQPKSTVFLYSK